MSYDDQVAALSPVMSGAAKKGASPHKAASKSAKAGKGEATGAKATHAMKGEGGGAKTGKAAKTPDAHPAKQPEPAAAPKPEDVSVSYKTMEGPHFGDLFHWSVGFDVSPGATGTIVQRIDSTLQGKEIHYGPNGYKDATYEWKGRKDFNLPKTYYEAWSVKDGKIDPAFTHENGAHDDFNRPTYLDYNNRFVKGMWSIAAQAYFVPDDPLGAKGLTGGHVDASKSLPSGTGWAGPLGSPKLTRNASGEYTRKNDKDQWDNDADIDHKGSVG